LFFSIGIIIIIQYKLTGLDDEGKTKVNAKKNIKYEAMLRTIQYMRSA